MTRQCEPVGPPPRPREAVFPAQNHRQSGHAPEFPLFKMRWTLLLLALASAAHSQDTCLSGNSDPYLFFGTKTAYNFANRQIPNIRPQDIPGCQPIAIWLVNRHGAHNPEANEVDDLEKLANFKNIVINNYRSGNHRLTEPRICPADLTLLDKWEWNPRHNKTFAGHLTSGGYMQTQQLGQTWRSRYPGLFSNNRFDYIFKYTTDKRSADSFRAFTEGLFGSQAENMDVPREHDEKLLRPYQSCPAWLRRAESNETLNQRRIFESKHEFAELVTNVSLRLGFNYDVDRAIIRRMYEMCRYNKAWDIAKISPWCSAFSREDLRHLEYAEDLETYNKYGYGDLAELNARLGCVQVKDFVYFFRRHVDHEEPQQPRASVQFVESPALLMLVSALGARRDPAPLTGDNYHSSAVQSRRWASSAMDPFNANLAAVLYKCNTNGNFGIKERYQVLFLQNEQTMNLQNCNVGLCNWSYVKKAFGEMADKCNLDLCNGAPSLNSFVALSLALVAFCFRYVIY